MKDNNETKKRVGKYALILVVMCIAAMAVTSMLWQASAKYRSGETTSSAYQEELLLEYEHQHLADLICQAQNASFGFYYLLQKKNLDYNVTPSDIFQNDAVFDWDDEITVSDDYSDEVSEFDRFVQENYYGFLEILSEYEMDYYIEDLTNKENYLTSVDDILLSSVKKKAETAAFYLELKISSDGIMQVVNIDQNFIGTKEQVPMWDNSLVDRAYDASFASAKGYPQSMKIYLFSDSYWYYDNIASDVYYESYYANRSDVMEIMAWSILIIGILNVAAAWILLSIKKWGLREGFLTKIPFEITICLGLAAIFYFSIIGAGCAGRFAYEVSMDISEFIPFIIGMWAAYFGTEILIFLTAGGIYSLALLGPKKYTQERTVFWKCVRWIKTHMVKLYKEAVQLVFDAKNNTTLLKVVLVNAVLVAFICCFWFVGIFGVIIYSIVVFIVANNYLKKLQSQYDVIHKAARDMAEGHLNTDMTGDAGAFEPIREDLAKVREGVKIAVEEEVKSQKMKTELITNVSHDLKTPLTAIITYTNLLKDEKLSEDDRRKYVDILDKKADRLKRLIEDLFEVSKANSGNIKVNKAWLDVSDLVRQATIENEDKLKNASIDLRLSLPLGKTMLELDGQKLYRIMDNLLGNVAKYSLPGTRAYVAVIDKGNEVTITVKNISASELPEDVSNLTERFVRGDESRHTEGSGLGLAIVKSFTELMGGTFAIRVDGDLFKATVVFVRAEAEKEKMTKMYEPLDTTIEEPDQSLSEESSRIFYREPKIKMSDNWEKADTTNEGKMKGALAQAEMQKQEETQPETAVEKVISTETENRDSGASICEVSKETENKVLEDTVKIEDVLNVNQE